MVVETVLQWFSSFLCGLLYGVAQDLGQSFLLFNIYLNPLGKVFQQHGIQHHHADDIQLQISIYVGQVVLFRGLLNA